jgi:hypothetical protein
LPRWEYSNGGLGCPSQMLPKMQQQAVDILFTEFPVFQGLVFILRFLDTETLKVKKPRLKLPPKAYDLLPFTIDAGRHIRMSAPP